LLRYCARPPFALERLRQAAQRARRQATRQAGQPARARPASSAQEPSA
jgi:hypothetical protein